MIVLVLFLAGVGLCIYKHAWWGALCFVFAVFALIG
jgi:hypothetical protein